MSASKSRPRYRNPPLVEVVLEFQFAGGADWDSIHHGRVADRLEGFPRVETVRGTSFLIGSDEIGFRQAPELKRFWREDNGLSVTIGPGLLGLSAQPPRMSEGHRWEALRDKAFDVLKVYRDVADPGAIRQVGLRYINAIKIKPAEFRLAEWVTDACGVVPPALLNEHSPFSFRLERATEVTPMHTRTEVVTLAAEPVHDAGGRLLLDVDQVTTWREGADPQAARAVLEGMHDAVHDVFERVIRKEVLKRFGPEPITVEET